MKVEIFRFLNTIDLQQCYQVCKSWQEMIIAYNLTSLDVTLPQRDVCDDDLIEFIKKTRLKVSSLHIKSIMSGDSDRLLQELGKTVRTLTVETHDGGEAGEDYFLKMLRLFPVLSELRFKVSARMTFTANDALKFESITSFTLFIHIWIDFSQIEKLVGFMPNLKHFGIQSGGISPHNDIIKTLRRQLRPLRSLDLENCRTNNGTFLIEKMTTLQGLCLEELTINISFVADKVILAFFAAQPRLEKLKIACTTEIPIDLVQTIVKQLPALKHLEIDVTEIVLNVEQYLMKLFVLPQLRSVRFEQKFVYESPGLPPLNFHNLPAALKLHHFRLVYFPVCSVPSMHEFCKAVKSLASLSLHSSQITNHELQIVFQHLQNLRSLDLSRSQRINDAGLIGYEKHGAKRTRIGQYSIKNLRGLKVLNIQGCKKITMKVFEEDFELLDLREVIMTEFPTNVNEMDNPNFRRLEVLKVSPKSLCSEDFFFRNLKNILPRLREIKEMYE